MTLKFGVKMTPTLRVTPKFGVIFGVIIVMTVRMTVTEAVTPKMTVKMTVTPRSHRLAAGGDSSGDP